MCNLGESKESKTFFDERARTRKSLSAALSEEGKMLGDGKFHMQAKNSVVEISSRKETRIVISTKSFTTSFHISVYLSIESFDSIENNQQRK
jgi:hypothetical protein